MAVRVTCRSTSCVALPVGLKRLVSPHSTNRTARACRRRDWSPVCNPRCSVSQASDSVDAPGCGSDGGGGSCKCLAAQLLRQRAQLVRPVRVLAHRVQMEVHHCKVRRRCCRRRWSPRSCFRTEEADEGMLRLRRRPDQDAGPVIPQRAFHMECQCLYWLHRPKQELGVPRDVLTVT